MALDDQLLDKARSAGALLNEAERRALLCRADYHTAIRRLHLAGGSLREIAQSLSLSHQRVQQIVSVAGGSWWTRVWRTRRVGPDAVCTWCGRPPAEVEKLIAGPRVYICDRCVAALEREAAAGAGAKAGGVRVKEIRVKCAFCSKRTIVHAARGAEAGGRVCPECLRLCREILDAAN